MERSASMSSHECTDYFASFPFTLSSQQLRFGKDTVMVLVKTPCESFPLQLSTTAISPEWSREEAEIYDKA